jgi:hypothetical protein
VTGLAERYLKAIDKVLSEGRLYLRFNNVFYKIKSVSIQDLNAKLECRNLQDGEEYEINFKIEKGLLNDLLEFGLKDSRDSVFIISEDQNRPIWFETSIAELIKEVERKELRSDIRRMLGRYADMEV